MSDDDWDCSGADVLKDIEDVLASINEIENPFTCQCEEYKQAIKDYPDRIWSATCYKHNIIYMSKAALDRLLSLVSYEN